MDQELETFKKTPFQSIAERFGYSVDERESSINSRILRGPNDDKISIRQEADAHWTYFSIRDEKDNGTIIDFVQLRKNLNLGQARKLLREVIKELGKGSPNSFSYCPPQETQKAKAKAKDPIPAPKSLLSGNDHRYLIGDRKIPTWIFGDPRFQGIILKDPDRGNVMFPHRNQAGICGYEVRNRKFAGYQGKREGFWITNGYRESMSIMICESAIDCLSHAALFPDQKNAYISLSGSMSREQKAFLKKILEWAFRTRKEIISGVDQDPAGDSFRRTFNNLAPTGMFIRPMFPPEAKDWNDVILGKTDRVAYF